MKQLDESCCFNYTRDQCKGQPNCVCGCHVPVEPKKGATLTYWSNLSGYQCLRCGAFHLNNPTRSMREQLEDTAAFRQAHSGLKCPTDNRQPT